MIEFAVVGCGHISSKHIQAIQEVPGARLAALCDPDLGQLERAGQGLAVKRFRSMEDMLREAPEIMAVCICTPSGLHAGLAVAAAAAGKHLLIEKPLALTLNAADEVAEAVHRAGVKAAVVHPNRYRPAMMALKAALERGVFGRLSHVNATIRWNRSQQYYDQATWRGTRLMDGGVLMNQAIHSIDLLQWLFGPVSEVKGLAATRLRSMEAEDVAVAALRFEQGALGVLEAATTIYDHSLEESISVFGERGYAVIGGPVANRIVHWECDSMSAEQQEALKQEINSNPQGAGGHAELIRDMVQAIAEDRPPAITLEDGRRAIKLVLDLLADAEAQRGIYAEMGGTR